MNRKSTRVPRAGIGGVMSMMVRTPSPELTLEFISHRNYLQRCRTSRDDHRRSCGNQFQKKSTLAWFFCVSHTQTSSSQSCSDAAFVSWKPSLQIHNQVNFYCLVTTWDMVFSESSRSRPGRYGHFCKSIQEEIEAGFPVDVLSQGRLTGRQIIKQGGETFAYLKIQQSAYGNAHIKRKSRVNICTICRNARPVGEGLWEVTSENQGWQVRFLCL